MEQVILGITEQYYFRVHINNKVYDFNVRSGHLDGAAAIKVSFVQHYKSFMIWVQIGAMQVGFYLVNNFSQYEQDKRNKAYFTKVL